MTLDNTVVGNSSSNDGGTTTRSERAGKKAKVPKPADFAKLEKAAKTIMMETDTNYYEWLHEQHKTFVEATIFNNLDNVGRLVAK